MNRQPALNEGFLPAVAALLVATAVVIIVALSAVSLGPVVVRLEILAVIVLALGIAFGVERVVALATAPALGGAMLAMAASEDLLWGRSLVIGCLWYLAVEMALASVEQRNGTERTPAVSRRRIYEVAMVVAIAAAVGAGGLLVASIAPARTLVIQVLVSLALLAALLGAVRHLINTTEIRSRT